MLIGRRVSSSVFSHFLGGAIIMYLVAAFPMIGGAHTQSPEFQPEPQHAEGDIPFRFPLVKGWTINEKIKVYSPETLYDYINGAAELYLSYDFMELRVAEYEAEGGASVVTEIYRHRSANDAFGIYSQERPAQGNYLEIGAQGYIDEAVLNFVAGVYYAKISCYDAGDRTEKILLAFARELARETGGNASLPSILRCFPVRMKEPNSEQYVKKNFLGYEFLHSGFKASYRDGKDTFTLIIIEGESADDCKGMLAKYLRQTGTSREELKEGGYRLSDPHLGEVELVWKGRYIWGSVACKDKKLSTVYLKRIELDLQKPR